MLLPQRKLLAAILISSLFTAGCLKDAVKSFGELQTLQVALTNKFGDEIDVHLSQGVNRGTLSVTFINSPLNDSSRQQRALRAQETAQIVSAHYSRSTAVNWIAVVFLRRRTQFVVFHRAQTLDSFVFGKDGRPTEYTAPYLPALTDTEITAGYSATEDRTDVSSASTLQLDGQPGGYGITVMPHFKLQGDARRRKAPPPEEVSFLVASYSRKPRFNATIPVEFIANGKPVMQGEATFTGNDAQYCSIKVSYSAFRKMATAEEAAIKLGAKEYPLTPEQLQLLLKMDAYVLE
ncbi:MAG TPA: hypothetical protein VFY61_07285 [Pyrinomonadaceae bacterium]|nr:hypothetical protein [Pyrinomonadaceae bacterium]